MKIKALLMVLSGKLKDKEIVVVENIKLEKTSTKKMKDILGKLPLSGKVLISMDKKSDSVFNSVKNIQNTSMIASDSLNVVDLLKNKMLVVDKKGVERIGEVYKI